MNYWRLDFVQVAQSWGNLHHNGSRFSLRNGFMLQQNLKLEFVKSFQSWNLTNYVPVSDKSPNHGHHSILGQYRMSWHQFQRRRIMRRSLNVEGSCGCCTRARHAWCNWLSCHLSSLCSTGEFCKPHTFVLSYQTPKKDDRYIIFS